MLIYIIYAMTVFAAVIFILVAAFVALMILKMTRGRRSAEKALSALRLEKISGFGEVDSLEVLPLIEYYASDEGFHTEEGVSYLLRSEKWCILFDTGYNKKGEHPSPLLLNMKRAGVSPEDIDKLVISHIHRDHIGGNVDERNRTFSFSAGSVDLSPLDVYSPGEISPSGFNPGHTVHRVTEPEIIDAGIASIGIYPRSLFFIGYTAEQSLAVNVKGKGLVLVIGCGHQGIDSILERARIIFDEPVYGIIGGLHLPVRGGRVMAGPFNLQNIVGVDRKPLRGIRETDVRKAIDAVKKADPKVVSISPHDSSDWTIGEFRKAFTDKFTDLSVGKSIII